MQSITVTLIGKDGCHLCDDADAVITEVVAGFSNVTRSHQVLEDSHPMAHEYADKIPVVLIDDVLHAYWRVKPERLADSLVKLGAISCKN
jgi:hypothetical protein